MLDTAHRLAVALLILCATLALAAVWPADAGAGLSAAHRQWMLVALAAALAAAVVWPALRLPAIGAAIAAKLAYGLAVALAGAVPATGQILAELGQLVALAAAGAIFLHEARVEARWNGVLPLRQEA
jgi:hypothetical protein